MPSGRKPQTHLPPGEYVRSDRRSELICHSIDFLRFYAVIGTLRACFCGQCEWRHQGFLSGFLSGFLKRWCFRRCSQKRRQP